MTVEFSRRTVSDKDASTYREHLVEIPDDCSEQTMEEILLNELPYVNGELAWIIRTNRDVIRIKIGMGHNIVERSFKNGWLESITTIKKIRAY